MMYIMKKIKDILFYILAFVFSFSIVKFLYGILALFVLLFSFIFLFYLIIKKTFFKLENNFFYNFLLCALLGIVFGFIDRTYTVALYSI